MSSPSTSPRLLIIIATYNELENLPELVQQLETLLPTADLLVIDDGSPDGTGEWCDERKATDPRLSVIHRPGKMGLGSATVAGFEYGLANDPPYDLLATMDADFSHDPKSLVELVQFLESDIQQDFGGVIGSRYVPGGGIENWPWMRHVSSRGVNFVAKFLLGLKTKDNSGAFRVYRASTLNSIDPGKIESSSFAYLEEILWRIRKQKIAMKELPITFRDRELGASKTSLKLGVSVFWHLLKIRMGLVK
ncbi:polyprenol monophosphomannose synthase [Mariniblastus fucicola]|uniref:polyprenol monophosphomannose synthase n=1 Tax=Mariniblastus fucicola TaxID=980251 RepID=UPI0009462AA0|nr:polyprenol monophosphomannose synthase [Mariniblastus fucicola]